MTADNEKILCIFKPHDAIQAGMIQSALESSGIPCFVDNENASALRFGGLATGIAEIRILVPESQTEQARQLITDLGFE